MILSLGQPGCRGQRWGLLSPLCTLASLEGPQAPWALSRLGWWWWRGLLASGHRVDLFCSSLCPWGPRGGFRAVVPRVPGPGPGPPWLAAPASGKVGVSLVFSPPAGRPECNALPGCLQPPSLDVPFPGVRESRVWQPPPRFAAGEIRIQLLPPGSPPILGWGSLGSRCIT